MRARGESDSMSRMNSTTAPPPDPAGSNAPLAYKPSDPETLRDPYPLFARMRAEDPVHWSAALGSWVLTSHADALAALTNPRLSADRITPFAENLEASRRAELAPLLEALGLWAVFRDPPDHTRLRGALNRGFTSRIVEALRPFIERTVDRLIDGMIAEREGAGAEGIDFIASFAYPLPATVIAHALGVPADDLDRFKSWSDDLAAFVGGAVATPDKRERAARGIGGLSKFFRGIIAERRARPTDDFVSELVAMDAEDASGGSQGGPGLSADEIVASCVLLLFAGHETTTNLLGNGMLALLRHPDQLEALRANPAGLGASAIEELLRYDSPAQAIVRIATEPVEIRGKRVEAGQRVFIMLNAANRDPAVFDSPDGLNLARRPNRHCAFGFGIHFCLGAALARLEGRVAFERLLARLGEWRLLTTDPKWNDTLVLRGVKEMRVDFVPLGDAARAE